MRDTKRGWIIVTLVSVLAFNIWFRGPFFGILPFGLFVLPVVLSVAWSMRYLKIPARVVAVLCVPLAACASWLMCAPPRTVSLIQTFLHAGTTLQSLGEVRRWNDNWARDPAYHLQFHINPAAAERVALNARLRPQDLGSARLSAKQSVQSHGTFTSAPDWWNPTEIEQLQAWAGPTRLGWTILCFDSATNSVYLSILTI